MSSPSSHALILIHGLGAHWLVMSPLARRLQKQFGRVINWSYSSLWSRIEHHGQRISEQLQQLDDDPNVERIHLITHSMGGIVARLALANRIPAKMGRMVMLAPPNTGSHVARSLAPVLGRLCPPLVQLSDEVRSFVATLPPPEKVDIGIIAARNDFLVAEPRTHLPTEKEHIVLPGMHSSLIWQKETAEQVAAFLVSGKFRQIAD
ncbi:MAG: alpha/beta fold hydrolase [Planctomycetales bacterium]|nr:alpha/beta fold hydrolase [Planctomycetales bacterium]